ncbi:hypothetical protein GQS65_06725 [Halomarina oriensis]|uniref:Phage holin family protein n=1 Tax=Halomarina oriensis TaxID=671145 RepID=A0A6B0GK38_9EURY|nr:hypothetical protein [Halomarina oriensis]
MAATILVFAINLIVGTGAIHLGAMLVVDRDTGYVRAGITALVGAVVWALVVFFLPGVPVLGPILGLVIFVTLINWQYPGGWVTAAAIGIVAWLVAVGLLWVLATFDLVGFQALGVPGA